VHDLDLDNPAHQETLRALRRAYPHMPVVLELAEATAREHAALLTGCHVIYPFDMDRLVQAVIDAVTTAKHQSRAVVP
jgi:DNA-binding NtrC family response regulator